MHCQVHKLVLFLVSNPHQECGSGTSYMSQSICDLTWLAVGGHVGCW